MHLHREKQYQVGIDSNGDVEYEYNVIRLKKMRI